MTRRRLLELASISAAAAACGGSVGTSATASPAAATSAATAAATATPIALGKPEKTTISLGLLGANFTSQVPALIALDKGFYKAAGFDDVKVVVTEQVTPGLLGGAIDFGIDNLSNIADNVNKGVAEKMIGIWRTYEIVLIAARPEIKSVKDLDGKDILLSATAGSRDFQQRSAYLKAAGWDLGTVKVNPVTAPGGSNAWLKLWQEKKLWLIPVFNRHRRQVLADSGHFVVDTVGWGNDGIVATTAAIQQRPNTTAQFLAATLKGMQVWMDLKQKDYVIGVADKFGFKLTEDEKFAYEADTKQYDAKADLGLEPEKFTAYLKDVFADKAPSVSAVTAFETLNKVQRSLGLTARPTQ